MKGTSAIIGQQKFYQLGKGDGIAGLPFSFGASILILGWIGWWSVNQGVAGCE